MKDQDSIGRARQLTPPLQRRNILYGMEEDDGLPPAEVPSLEDVHEAARLANIHESIMAMPQGYETVCLQLCTTRCT